MSSMKHSSIILVSLAALGVAVTGWLFAPNSENKKSPAAIMQKTVSEASLNTVTLSEETEARLGIIVGPIVVKPVQRTRLYGGEIITPVGRRGVVTAPFGGILKAPTDGLPKAGDTVKRGQVIFVLYPLLTPEARSASATAQVDAEAQVQNAATQLQAAKNALERARQLFADQVGARRGIEEAQAAHDIASKSLEAARARQNLLEDSLNGSTSAPVMIAAPEDGVVRKLSAAHSQNVPGGAALFEMGGLSTAWVRASLPVGDLEDIARDREAQVGSLSARASSAMQPAMAVSAPPLANAQSFTVDLLYVLHSSETEAIPGQRVGVRLPLNDAGESLTLPASAVVFDALGGSWVYEQTEPRTYVRKRVSVSYIAGTDAVLASGPAAGAQIMTVGAQAVFGAETGMK